MLQSRRSRRLGLSLTTKMVLSVALTGVVSGYAAFLAHTRFIVQAIEQREFERAAGLRGAIGVALAQLFQDMQRNARLLGQQPQLVADAAADAPPELRRQRLARWLDPAYRVLDAGILEVIDRDQRVLYRAHAPDRFGDVQALSGLHEALSGFEAASTAPGSAGLAMRFALPLGSAPMPAAALVLGRLVDDAFAQRIGTEAGATVAIFSPQGEVMAASISRSAIGPLISPVAIANSLRGKDKAHAGPVHGSLTSVYFAQTLLDQTYVWMVAVDSGSAQQQIQKAQTATLAASLLFGGLSATLLGWLAHRHGRRLGQLQQEAEQAVQHLAHDAGDPPALGDEIDALASATRAMARRLTADVQRLQVLSAAVAAELVQKDAELLRRETMAQLGSLVAGVAHEVRNPLFGITSTLDALQARMQGEPTYQRHMSVLRGETAKLQRLMHDLLDYGKPVAVQRIASDPLAIIRAAVASCAALASRAQVATSCELRGHAPLLLLDPSGMHQVLVNLIENALQVSPPGSRVTVAAGSAGSDAAAVFICTVADSGPGFRQEDLGRIFEPFFTRRAGGTGLGLSIVQRIVEAHGGSISAANQPRGGALVTLRLPQTRQALQPTPEALQAGA